MKKKISLRELKLKKLRFKRLTYRSGLVLLGIIATVIIAFNFWFVDHAEGALEQIVYNQSKGKLKLKIQLFKFNWITNNILLDETSIYSTDTTAPISYSVNTKRIAIKARGFLPLLFNKEILIDSIRLTTPQIVFSRNIARVKNKVNRDTSKSNFSVAEEMGRISKSISDVINVLKVDKFRLDNGSFSLVDNTKPNAPPFAVSKVYIQLDNLRFDSTKAGKKGKEKISFTDNIAIRTFDQSLVFPGGRHFIAFKDFRVNLANKRVEFDSCTIRAIKGDSSRTSFRIFFDKLQLTNINFDSLYSSETIIADSVFCSRPQIFFDIDGDIPKSKQSKSVSEKKDGLERIDAVMQQLLGDMVLNYVGFKNADINVSTIKHAQSSSFSSSDNNFEIYGLVVRQNEQRPIHLNKFIMSLHNFENVLRDGRYKIAFDSIGFEDDVINLSKFSFKEYHNGTPIKSLAMPSFQVRGLSWEHLLYDNVFSAQSASFFKPVVDYRTSAKKKKSKNLFETLNSVDDVMDLKNLKIQQGEIVLRFGKVATLALYNTNLDLRAEDFASANKLRSVQRSVNTLNFDKGVFKKDDLVAHLDKVYLSENKSGLKASSMLLHSNNIHANASNINLGNIILDSSSKSIIVNGVSWSNASLTLTKAAQAKHKPHKNIKANTPLILKSINGHNTKVDLDLQKNKVSGFFNAIVLNDFTKNTAGKPIIKGLSLDGKELIFEGVDTKASISKLAITDNNNSVLTDIKFEKINQLDSIIAVIPRLTIIPNITEIVSGNLTLQGLVLADPVVFAKLGKKDKSDDNKTNKKNASSIKIGSALFERPEIKLTLINKNDSASYISWDGAKLNSYLKVNNLQSTSEVPLKADQIKMFLTNFKLISAKGKKIATNDNKLDLELNDIVLKKNSEDKLEWQTSLNILSLDKLHFDSLGKNNAELNIDKGDVRNIALNSKYINKPAAIIANSTQLNISGTNGRFITGKNMLEWYGFNVKNRIVGVDSFSLIPHQPVEEYRIAKAFNEDFLKIHTGKIAAGPIDMEKFNRDSILSIDYVQLNDVDLFTFKDKTQPDTVVKYKPLPAEMLKKLNSSLDIDSVRINNMNVTYWEINPKTDTLGIIDVKRLNVLLRNIKNHNIQPKDSIYILATADVLGKLHTNLDVAQSYFDTTGYMRMDVTTGPMDLTGFNTVLVPMVGAKVFDGRLQNLQVHAIGNNEAAIGNAHMYYRKLNIGLLNKKDLPNQTFVNKFVSKIAMAFIVRRNNRGKESLVFFERWQEKSPINYIIKTTLEGIKSSIGLPGAQKKLRKYNKRIAANDK